MFFFIRLKVTKSLLNWTLNLNGFYRIQFFYQFHKTQACQQIWFDITMNDIQMNLWVKK